MTSDRIQAWRRWADAERDRRLDDADAALQSVFSALPMQPPPEGFAGRVSLAITRDVARQKRLAKAAVATVVAGASTLAAVVLFELPQIVRAVFELSVRAVVWAVLAFQRGLDVWAVLAEAGRTLGAVLLAPQMTAVLIGLGLLSVGALYALNRVLEPGEGPSL